MAVLLFEVNLKYILMQFFYDFKYSNVDLLINNVYQLFLTLIVARG